MKAEPPTGDEFTTLLVTVKERVMKNTASPQRPRRRVGRAGIVATVAGVLIVGGGGAAVATGYFADLGSTFIPIPHSSNRPTEPPLPADYDQNTNSELQPEEASLGQLWAGANSETAGDDFSQQIGIGVGLGDFADAVAIRCYPLRTEEESAELEQLRRSYEILEGPEQLTAAQAYFARATELCM